MSKSAKAYGAAALVLIGFPLLLSLWSLSVAMMAILLLGIGAYATAVCVVLSSFLYRHLSGRWPLEFDEEPPPAKHYQPSQESR